MSIWIKIIIMMIHVIITIMMFIDVHYHYILLCRFYSDGWLGLPIKIFPHPRPRERCLMGTILCREALSAASCAARRCASEAHGFHGPRRVDTLGWTTIATENHHFESVNQRKSTSSMGYMFSYATNYQRVIIVPWTWSWHLPCHFSRSFPRCLDGGHTPS